MLDERDLPIDIHSSKLIDWLVSRRHVRKDWPTAVQEIRQKINDALQDMPEHPEITKLLIGTYINYFHCLKIIEILKETEKDSKNILGWYTSQRMKDWQEIVRLYERDNVCLVEAAQLLVRSVTFEVTSVKRQIAKCSQTQQECDRKEQDLIKQSEFWKNAYNNACKQIGISGKQISLELLGLLEALPDEFESIVVMTKGLKEMCNLYKEFVAFTVTDPWPCLTLLTFFTDRGNVTVYEWETGEPPIEIEKGNNTHELQHELMMQQEAVEDDDKESSIDFCDDIDLCLDEGEELSTGDIDWGGEGDDGGDASIDWEITEESGSFGGIEVTESGADGGVARGNQALSLLAHSPTRKRLLAELMELEGFLRQRLCEKSDEESILSLQQFSTAPEAVQSESEDNLKNALLCVSDVIEALSSTRMKHLYLISDSPKYVNRLSASLQSKLQKSEAVLKSVSAVHQRREKAMQQQNELYPKQEHMITRAKELKKQIEQEISLKYKNRPVNIMGEVNLL